MRKFLLLAFLLLSVLPAKAQLLDPGCAPPATTQLESCRTIGLGNAGYPIGSTPIFATFNGANTGGASTSFSLSTGQLSYLCWLNISGLGATAATTVTPTITQLAGAATITLTGMFTYPAGATVAATPLTIQFSPCPRGGTITVTVPGAAGNTSLSINMFGYQQ